MTGVSTGGVIAASVWAGGLATLLEKKTRRMELAHYCAARALESFARCLSAWGWLGPPDARWRRLRLDVLLFSLACGSIMHCYSDDGGAHRDVFRSKYISVLDSIFGNRGHETVRQCGGGMLTTPSVWIPL